MQEAEGTYRALQVSGVSSLTTEIDEVFSTKNNVFSFLCVIINSIIDHSLDLMVDDISFF